jgi:hypothetical protein
MRRLVVAAFVLGCLWLAFAPDRQPEGMRLVCEPSRGAPTTRRPIPARRADLSGLAASVGRAQEQGVIEEAAIEASAIEDIEVIPHTEAEYGDPEIIGEETIVVEGTMVPIDTSPAGTSIVLPDAPVVDVDVEKTD